MRSFLSPFLATTFWFRLKLFKIKFAVKKFYLRYTKINGHFHDVDVFNAFVQGSHQLSKLFGCAGPLIMIATPAGRHQVRLGMHVFLKTIGIKPLPALRQVMIDLHAFVFHRFATIGTSAAKFLVNPHSYCFPQRHRQLKYAEQNTLFRHSKTAG